MACQQKRLNSVVVRVENLVMNKESRNKMCLSKKETHHFVNWELDSLCHYVSIARDHGTAVVVHSLPVTADTVRKHVYSSTLHTQQTTS